MVEFCLEKLGLGQGGNVNRVLRLVKGGKVSTHVVREKRDTESEEQRALGAGTHVKSLGWYLADNISDVRGRAAK